MNGPLIGHVINGDPGKAQRRYPSAYRDPPLSRLRCHSRRCAGTCRLAAIVSANGQTAQSPLPPPIGYVNDYAKVIDNATKRQLETTLTNLDQQQQIQFSVVTVDTTGGQEIFDYSLAVARGWGIGSKDTQKPSLLLLVAIKDRKYFTQVSRHLEGDLPDGLVPHAWGGRYRGQTQKWYALRFTGDDSRNAAHDLQLPGLASTLAHTYRSPDPFAAHSDDAELTAGIISLLSSIAVLNAGKM